MSKQKKKQLDSSDPRYMTPEQEQIVNMILSSNSMKTGKDVSEVFNSLRGKVIQRLLDAEMDEFLGYNKGSHDEKTNSNRRNGSTSKAKKLKLIMVKLQFVHLEIEKENLNLKLLRKGKKF